MDRRLATSAEQISLRIDPTRCDGQGVCVLIAPELFALDRYGDAYVLAESDKLAATDPEIRARGLEAEAMCPRNAIRVETAPPARRELHVYEPASMTSQPRLVVGEPESVTVWRGRGGWQSLAPDAVLARVRQAGIFGQGGAAFPAHVKWSRIASTGEPVLIVNGAEREPGTLKDRYLLRNRAGLVLDGARLAMRAIGASQAHIAVDDESDTEFSSVVTALAEARAAGLLDGLDFTVHRVPARYVAGEETALISFIGGGRPVPRLRPPFPSDTGLSGRPTLVHNVETIAQVALAVTFGADWYRAAGAPDAPGTGLFSIGPFGGPFQVFERPYGYSLRQLIDDAGLTAGMRAVLVGGYAGGLLAPSDLDVALTPDSIAALGVSLGTKSVQIIDSSACPVDVTARIVEYFAGETAEQCPPCSRGLPDMAKALRELDGGAATVAGVADVETFMSTLFGRGVCRLPDGAARVTMTLLERFAVEVAVHLESGCPHR
jgi:NADH-quinone oxidoreductase subunit F